MADANSFVLLVNIYENDCEDKALDKISALASDWTERSMCRMYKWKFKRFVPFFFLLFFKKVAIRYSLNFKAIRLCANVECFTKLQIEKHTVRTTEEPIFGYLCCPVCKLCAKHSKSKLKDTRSNCSVSFQLFYQWWTRCLLMKNTSACQVTEKQPW